MTAVTGCGKNERQKGKEKDKRRNENENEKENEKACESSMNGMLGLSECRRNEITKEADQRWWDREELIKQQDQDKMWGQLKRFLNKVTTEYPSQIRMPIERFQIRNNVLLVAYVKRGNVIGYRTVLPRSFVQLALMNCHNSAWAGHLGHAGTLKRCQENFYWIGQDKDVKAHIKGCHECACVKSSKLVTPDARVWPLVKAKWQRCHVDLIGPLPLSHDDQKYIFVICDTLTRFTFIHAMVDKSADSVAKAMVKFMNQFGTPGELISDCRTEFLNEVFSSLLKTYGVRHTPIQSYRPSSNGLVESKNKHIVNMLRFIVRDNPSFWTDHLGTVQFALNTAYNKSVGDTPFFLMYAQDPRYPFELFTDFKCLPVYNIDSYKTYICNATKRCFESVSLFLKQSQERHRVDYNLRFKTGQIDIALGDRVYIKRLAPKEHKLQSRFLGPYRVIDVHYDSIKLREIVSGKEVTTHRSYVKVIPEPLVTADNNKNVDQLYPVHDVTQDNDL